MHMAIHRIHTQLLCKSKYCCQKEEKNEQRGNKYHREVQKEKEKQRQVLSGRTVGSAYNHRLPAGNLVFQHQLVDLLKNSIFSSQLHAQLLLHRLYVKSA